jgi:hypothetical protein
MNMSKVVKIGYADYMDETGELIVLKLVELRVHVYREDPLGWDPRFWSVWHYHDKEGKERGNGQYFKDFETADLRFMDRKPLAMFSVRSVCPKCGYEEAMYNYREGKKCCMACGHCLSI